MGTAVLLPQDCLRSRSRYKHQTSGMIYPPERAPRSKRNLPPLGPSQEPGLLPLPGHGPHALPINRWRRGSETKHYKARKVPEQRDNNTLLKGATGTSPDIPAYRILQRPKQGEAAVELLAHFVRLDGANAVSVIKQVKNLPVNGSPIEGMRVADKYIAAQSRAFTVPVNGSKLKNRALDTKVDRVSDEGRELKDASKYANEAYRSISEGCKPSNIKGGVPKPNNVMKEKLCNGYNSVVCSQGSNAPTSASVTAKPFMKKAADKVNDVTCNAMMVQCTEENDLVLSSGSERLRRTSTEPQMAKHILGQYRSKVMHISFNDADLGSRAHSHEFLEHNGSLSFEERWAGPAYTSSPSPSSLPLPKRCLPHSRFSSLDLPPLVKHYSSSVYMQPFLGSSAPTFVASENGGAWDAAFVTKSLRKMLNLDPC